MTKRVKRGGGKGGKKGGARGLLDEVRQKHTKIYGAKKTEVRKYNATIPQSHTEKPSDMGDGRKGQKKKAAGTRIKLVLKKKQQKVAHSREEKKW